MVKIARYLDDTINENCKKMFGSFYYGMEIHVGFRSNDDKRIFDNEIAITFFYKNLWFDTIFLRVDYLLGVENTVYLTLDRYFRSQVIKDRRDRLDILRELGLI